MDPEFRKLFRENVELTKENNKLLHKLHRSVVWGRAFRLLYWLVIIGISFGAYYILQPFLEGFMDAYNGLQSGVQQLQDIGGSIPSVPALPDLWSFFDRFSK